ncbi:hypothetical protein J2Z65_002978 [Paenibacillus aceris]|uniref:Uncharacterized protein n=1 Tax=Paenibacillus aceris TaxID=869555 RepID=A0ABS4I0U6_9BACL|nr:hypothetical protein [Paenibacillus aceris]
MKMEHRMKIEREPAAAVSVPNRAGSGSLTAYGDYAYVLERILSVFIWAAV